MVNQSDFLMFFNKGYNLIIATYWLYQVVLDLLHLNHQSWIIFSSFKPGAEHFTEEKILQNLKYM